MGERRKTAFTPVRCEVSLPDLRFACLRHIFVTQKFGRDVTSSGGERPTTKSLPPFNDAIIHVKTRYC